MKTIEINTYEFNELSEDVKEKVINDFRGTMEYYGDENEATLKAFEKIFPVNVNKWSYGGDRSDGINYDITEHEEDILNLSGLRLSKYLWNNYKNQIYKGKYYSSRMIEIKGAEKPPYYKYKYRHSKCYLEKDCVLTGYFMDNAILDPIYKAIDHPTNKTFEEILEDCLNNWIEQCTKDVEDQNSDESIEDFIEANEYMFTENGKIIR